MYKLIILLILLILIKPAKKEPLTQIPVNIKYIVISKSSCPACIKYKTTHENIVKELKNKYPNLQSEIIENDEKKNSLYNIKFFPTFIIEKNNKVSKLGCVNFWINSKIYNYVENMHQIILLSIIDLIISTKR